MFIVYQVFHSFQKIHDWRLYKRISYGDPIISHTLSLRTVESEIAKSLSNVQDNNKDVDIGSYPFLKQEN